MCIRDRFGSDLDKATQQQLARGVRLVETLKQPEYNPMPWEEQVITIFAATKGYLDGFPVSEIQRFEEGFLSLMKSKHSELMKQISDDLSISDDSSSKLMSVLDEYVKSFAA